MRFCESSAKDNFNVDEIFLKLVDDIISKVSVCAPLWWFRFCLINHCFIYICLPLIVFFYTCCSLGAVIVRIFMDFLLLLKKLHNKEWLEEWKIHLHAPWLVNKWMTKHFDLTFSSQMPLEMSNKELSSSILSLQPEPEVPPELPPPQKSCCWAVSSPEPSHTTPPSTNQYVHQGAAHGSICQEWTLHAVFSSSPVLVSVLYGMCTTLTFWLHPFPDQAPVHSTQTTSDR